MPVRKPVNLVTTADIAKRLRTATQPDQVDARDQAPSSAKPPEAGIVRVYSTAVIALIQDEIDTMDARRCRKAVTNG